MGLLSRSARSVLGQTQSLHKEGAGVSERTRRKERERRREGGSQLLTLPGHTDGSSKKLAEWVWGSQDMYQKGAHVNPTQILFVGCRGTLG